MEPYLQISKINDFIFCPRSIYLHNIYEDFKTVLFHSAYQTVGKIKHENIEDKRYSTAKRYLQGLEIYCAKYCLAGKLDIYDKEEGILIERKYQVKNIFDGYRYQLYAQYFCLKEMGYEVNKLRVHSLKDNKRYAIKVPGIKEEKEFSQVLEKINSYCLEKDAETVFEKNEQKCAQCIYRELCF